MGIALDVRNTSKHRRCYRSDVLLRLAERVCAGEGVAGELELSLLLCDDEQIQELNRAYRKVDRPTDVLSFGQDAEVLRRGSRVHPAPLGDIVISLETVARRRGDAAAMRQELRMLFCHGLLHLLGYDHGAPAEREAMAAKQAAYLGLPLEQAWPEDSGKKHRSTRGHAGRGGKHSLGRR